MIKELLKRYPSLASCEREIITAKKILIECYQNNGKVLLCGNGGSCADCDHIVGELMKGFQHTRPLSDEQKSVMRINYNEIDDYILEKLQNALPTISLPSFNALNTAFSNDVDPDLLYAQSVLGLAASNDILFVISTSGNSKNILNAVKTAKSLGVKVLALSGKNGGALRKLSDVCIIAPENETYKIQELHLPIYHYLCAEIEKFFFGCGR